MILQYCGIIRRVATMVDGGYNIATHTQELDPVGGAALLAAKGIYGWFKFNPGDVPPPDPPPYEGKSPSERLRGALYRKWESGDKTIPFESMYESFISQIINGLR